MEYAGFNKLRPGRIHIYCTECGRKMSNMPRSEYDPPNATLAQIWCDKCGQGCKDSAPNYLDKDGRFLRELDEEKE